MRFGGFCPDIKWKHSRMQKYARRKQTQHEKEIFKSIKKDIDCAVFNIVSKNLMLVADFNIYPESRFMCHFFFVELCKFYFE